MTRALSRRQLLRAGSGAALWALAGFRRTSSAAREPGRITSRPSPHRLGRAGRAVTLLVLHESAGVTDRNTLASVTERIGLSYHAIIDLDGLTYTVNRDDGCQALAQGGNLISDQLCLTTPRAGYTREEWLGPQRNKVDFASWWLATVADQRELDLIECSDQNIRDAAAGSKQAGGVTSHADWDRVMHDPTPHTDPRNFPFDVCLEQARGVAG